MRRPRPALNQRELAQLNASIASGQQARLDEIAGRRFRYALNEQLRFPFRSKLFDLYAERAGLKLLASRPLDARIDIPDTFS